jgi:hypothetical protein
MNVLGWILVVSAAWLALAGVGVIVLGKVIRNRDRQVPVDSVLNDGPTFAAKEFCVHQGDPDDNANLRFIAKGPEGRQQALNYAAAVGGKVSERSVIVSEWRAVVREAS